MRKLVLLFVLLVGLVISNGIFAQDCGTTANGKVSENYCNTVPTKRIVHRDGKTYLQVFYYMPGGLTKLRTRKWDIMQKIFGCGRGCGLCAGGIIVYDITNGEPQFVGYEMLMEKTCLREHSKTSLVNGNCQDGKLYQTVRAY